MILSTVPFLLANNVGLQSGLNTTKSNNINITTIQINKFVSGEITGGDNYYKFTPIYSDIHKITYFGDVEITLYDSNFDEISSIDGAYYLFMGVERFVKVSGDDGNYGFVISGMLMGEIHTATITAS